MVWSLACARSLKLNFRRFPSWAIDAVTSVVLVSIYGCPDCGDRSGSQCNCGTATEEASRASVPTRAGSAEFLSGQGSWPCGDTLKCVYTRRVPVDVLRSSFKASSGSIPWFPTCIPLTSSYRDELADWLHAGVSAAERGGSLRPCSRSLAHPARSLVICSIAYHTNSPQSQLWKSPGPRA